MENQSCTIEVSMAPSGFVTNVQTVNGDNSVCNASKRAVYKAGTLPVSKDPKVFKIMRKLTLVISPVFN
jgi:colicin import membrane protein